LEELLSKVATIANVLIDVVLELKLNQKWMKFCMKEVFKCRERRMMR
jgi:hypothetical protein